MTLVAVPVPGIRDVRTSTLADEPFPAMQACNGERLLPYAKYSVPGTWLLEMGGPLGVAG